MKKYFFILFLSILTSNCTLDKVINDHGTKFIDEKEKKLIVNSTNKNDIIKLLGPPSTKSMFDNDVWIYIERNKAKRSLLSIGAEKTYTNNVLVLEIDNKGLLVKKELHQIDKMNKINFSNDKTTVNYSKNSFTYDFLNSLRQKINNPKNSRQN